MANARAEERRQILKTLVLVCLSLLLSLSMFGNFVPQTRAPPSGSWYKLQMDTHTAYSSLGYAPAMSLYNACRTWKLKGFDVVVVKDCFLKVPQEGYVGYAASPNFDPSAPYYDFNYSVSGSPLESNADWSSSYPSYGAGAGSGNLYVNGTGKAMVSLNTSRIADSRKTLDLYRHQLLQWFYLNIAGWAGNVAIGVEIRFESGRNIIIYAKNGTATYNNSSSTRYFSSLQGQRTTSPYLFQSPLDEENHWHGCNLFSGETVVNAYFNFTKAYLETWNQTAYLSDRLLDFRWFVESFDVDSWINTHIDKMNWEGNNCWASYTSDIDFSQEEHDILLIPSLEISGLGEKNEAFAININASGFDYDGSIEKFLTIPNQILERGGIPLLDELYMFPNGTEYEYNSERNCVDWLGYGFHGTTIMYYGWDDALKVIFDEERDERLYYSAGSDLNSNYTERILRGTYSMIYIEGDLTRESVAEALYDGHYQTIYPKRFNEVLHTNLTIQDFSLSAGSSSWIMGDWATPTSSPVVNIDVTCDVDIYKVVLYWNGKELRRWYPNTKTFNEQLNLDISGVLRLVAFDSENDYTVYSNPIFVKPSNMPYITETTYPLDFSSRYETNKFTLTISGYGTSTTKAHCGDRGEPMAFFTVNGNLAWSYNASTTILTLNVTHESPTRILIYWKFPGDVNDDGIVDVVDLHLMGKAYGSTPGSPNWDEGCDINGDEIVGQTDLSMVGEDY